MVFKKVFGFIWFLLYLAIIGLFGCSQNIVLTVSSGKPGTVINGEPVEDYLSVSHHASVTFSDGDADKILQIATEVAQSKDGPDDVACDVTLAPEGSVNEFTNSATPSFINSFYDYQTVVFENPSDVKVLAGMDWCGVFIPNLLGCTAPGDYITVVSDLPQNLRGPENEDKIKGILWLHEYGHIVGLEHRNEANAFMNEELELHRTRLNDAECG